MTNLDSILKSRHYFADKGPSSQSYSFSSSHVWMWELDYKENWALNNWCFWTVVLEKTLESPLDCKKIQPVPPKGNQSWIFIGKTDAKAEAPILWPPHAKNWLTGKDPDPGKDQRQEEKGITEGEIVGWHHQLDGHEFEQAPGVGDGQRSLVCCSPWGRKEPDMTKWLNWTELAATWTQMSNTVALLEQRVTAFGGWVHSKENTKCPVEAVSGPGTSFYPYGWAFSSQLYRVLSFQPVLVWGFLWPVHSEENFPHHHSSSHFQVLFYISSDWKLFY